MKTLQSTTGIKIKAPDKFYEQYDSSLKIRRYGADNLFPQTINDFYNTSPTFNSCAERLASFLFGEGSDSKIINNKILKSILTDYAKFNGFALHIQYNGLGDIININYVPFETIRLREQGTNGKYTYCYYCSDWSGQTTINTKKVNPQKDRVKYFIYTDNLETRLQRINSCAGDYLGEILYFSNTISYPVSPVNSVLNYVSAEIGLSNIIYRDVRSNFTPSSVIAIPKQSEEDYNAFAQNLSDLQGDESSFKILMMEFNSADDKPEVLNLQGEDYWVRYQGIISECKSKIVGAFHQEQFIRLEDGSLGFGSEAIAEIYKFYNFFLRGIRKEIISVLKSIDPIFDIKELVYEVTPSQINTVDNV